MIKLKYTCAFVAFVSGAGMAQAGTITISGTDAADYVVTSADVASPAASLGGDEKSAFERAADAINDNHTDISANTQMIADFQKLFGSVQTTAPAPLTDGNKAAFVNTAGTAMNDVRQIESALKDGSQAKADWKAYLDHVEAKAAAGEKITMQKPADPVAADFTSGTVPTGMAAQLTALQGAVSTYETVQAPHDSFSTFSEANQADASGRAAAQAFANGEGLANGILASFNAVDAKIGDINTLPSDLQAATPSETSVVSAMTKLNEKVGDLSALDSTFTGSARTSLVSAVNSNSSRITANSDAIAKNSSRIVALEEDVDELQAGVAMAIAIANAPVIQGGYSGISLSGGFGHFKGKSAGSMKAAFMPMENMAITASVATDFDDNVAAGAGLGFAF